MRTLTQLLALLVFVSIPTVHGATWLYGGDKATLAAAATQAKSEGKLLMINFTGSDWCGWCIKLKEEVFSKPEFDEFASKHLVLLEIDFPRKTPQPAALKQANQAAAQSLNIKGYPTLLFFDSEGKEILRTGYQPGGASAFVGGISKLVRSPTAGTAVQARSAPTPAKEVPLFGGAPTFAPVRYTNLVLKSISGTENRRFALLNNQTFAVGETASVKLLDSQVKVRCVEIRDQSVVVSVQGQPGLQEIALRGER